jgi:hypothetical protein
MKTCSRCKKAQPIACFSTDKSRRDGLSSWCLDCRRAQKATYLARPGEKERQAARVRAWMAKNRNQVAARARTYREKNATTIEARSLEYRRANREAINARGRAWAKTEAGKKRRIGHRLKTRYGLTPEQRDTLFARQGHACAICKTTESTRPWNVDHCHTTGRVRAILCERCNIVVGRVEEDAAVAQSIADYIRDVCEPIKKSA